MILSIALEAQLVSAQALGNTKPILNQGGGGGYSGRDNVSEGGGEGDCDKNCTIITTSIVSGIILLCLVSMFAFICCECKTNCCACRRKRRETSSDLSDTRSYESSLITECPFNNPHLWVATDTTIIEMMESEMASTVGYLKNNPEILNGQWDGVYTEPGPGGTFTPNLEFSWDAENNLILFKSTDDATDTYGGYRIKNGMINLINSRFVAHKEYFNPSKQDTPYTIVQAGEIKIVRNPEANNIFNIEATGRWYSSYMYSVQGTFHYAKKDLDLQPSNNVLEPQLIYRL